jgi:hypothetical protein
MAKRRSREQINADKIIKKELAVMAGKIHSQATLTSRIAKDTQFIDGGINKAGGTLRDSQNWDFLNDTTLLMVQVEYGRYNYPKGNNTKRTYSGGKVVITDGMNALLQAINDHLEDATAIIVQSLSEAILKDYK